MAFACRDGPNGGIRRDPPGFLVWIGKFELRAQVQSFRDFAHLGHWGNGFLLNEVQMATSHFCCAVSKVLDCIWSTWKYNKFVRHLWSCHVTWMCKPIPSFIPAFEIVSATTITPSRTSSIHLVWVCASVCRGHLWIFRPLQKNDADTLLEIYFMFPGQKGTIFNSQPVVKPFQHVWWKSIIHGLFGALGTCVCDFIFIALIEIYF